MTNTSPELLVITGMSGAGRSTVGNALEDLGWYVVDNLPPQMLGPISDLFSVSKTPLPKLAVVIDVRGREFFTELLDSLALLRGRSINLRLVFLEATDSSLVKRFESVRRPHPLQANGTLLDGIETERKQLISVRESADVVIDTTELNIHQLSTHIAEQFSLNQSTSLHTLQARALRKQLQVRLHALQQVGLDIVRHRAYLGTIFTEGDFPNLMLTPQK